MSKVSRSDVFARDERGGEWFNDFLREFAQQKTSGTKEILEAINNKRGETVESVVSKYREAVGLDTFADEQKADDLKAEASVRPLSIRHAQMLSDDKEDEEKKEKPEDAENIVVVIEGDPELKAELESIFEATNGTKNTHSIINFLREILGNDLVSYSDDNLLSYIDDMKNKYKVTPDEPKAATSLLVGTDTEYFDDDKADFIEHGKGK